jgi:TonB family protein
MPEAARFDVPATAPESVPFNEGLVVAAQQSTAQRMGLAAAVVIAVAAMGVPLGVWIAMRHRPQPEPPQTAVAPVQRPATSSAPLSPVVAPAKNTEVLAPQPTAVADAQPKTTAAVLPSVNANKPVAPKGARKVEPARRPVALQSAPVPVVQGLAALPASAVAAQPVAELPRPVAPAPPAGRLFEAGDVDESPRVATRVEPRLDDDVVKRYPKDVVVVRVLVSQAGHPFRVSLLRRSLGGRPVDDAVVAAVSAWTFSPAKKRGEAVSCWMNVGVAVGR